MKTIDARGLGCPKPVIITKKELDKMAEGRLITIVDNEVAKENISKLVNSLGSSFKIEERDGDYYIDINKELQEVKATIEIKSEASEVSDKSEETIKDMTIGISSETMGSGDDKLGKILMKSFIYTVSETLPYPSTIVFYNAGVRLTLEDSEVLDDLITLEKNGVEIISCGTCLDFLELKDKLAIGSISNMYTIYEKLKDRESNLIIG